MATPLGISRGSSLNLEWSKCGIWLVDQWRSISWLHIESFLCMLRYCIGTLMIDLSWLGILRCLFLLCFIAIFVWDIDMLIISIDNLVSLSIVTLILPWLFWSPRMYRFIVVYHLTWWIDSHVCILSWSSSSMMSVSLFILIIISCVWTWWYICTLLDYVLHDCPPSAWLHVVCLCGLHIYPLTSNSHGFDHSLHSGSHYCKCEAFCVLVLWLSQRLRVGSTDGLYRCLGTFWRCPTHRCRLEFDHWRPI